MASLAFSADGKSLVSGGNDSTVRIWAVERGKELRPTAGHQGGVDQVAISPDGRLLATAGWQRLIHLWDPATGKELRQVGGQDGVHSLAFAPDGQTLAAAVVQTSPKPHFFIRLLDPATGKEMRRCEGHGDVICSLSFLADGKTLVSGSEDGTFRLWGVADGKERRRFPGRSGVFLYGAAVSPDGKTLAVADSGKEIHLRDLTTGKDHRKLTLDTETTSAVYSPDGRTLAAAGWDGTVYLWDLVAGGEPVRFPAHKERERVFCVAFSPDGRSLVSASEDSLSGCGRRPR